jgi:hypothetical protein
MCGLKVPRARVAALGVATPARRTNAPAASRLHTRTFDVKLDEFLERREVLAGDILRGTGSGPFTDFDLGEIARDWSDEKAAIQGGRRTA